MQSQTRIELLRRLRRSSPYGRLREQGGRVERLPVAAAAWVLGALAQDLRRPLLVVTPHESQALEFRQAAQLLGTEVDLFAAPSLTPYQATAASVAVRAREVEVLDRLLTGKTRCVIATPRSLFRILPPQQEFAATVMVVAPGDQVTVEELVAAMESSGYSRRELVTDIGEYAVRGGIVDCFPPGAEQPVRMDYFGDEVETLRRFDVDSQRSSGSLEEIRLPPVTLFSRPDALSLLGRCLSGSEMGYEAMQVVEAAQRGEAFAGWENYLPVLAGERSTLAQWLGEKSIVAAVAPTETLREIEEHAEALASDFQLRIEAGQLALEPERLEHASSVVRGIVEEAWIQLDDLRSPGDSEPGIDFGGSGTDLFHEQLPRFATEVEAAAGRGERILVVTGAGDRRGRVERLCEHYALAVGEGGIEFVEGRLDRGFRLPAIAVSVFSETQLFRSPPTAPRRRASLGSLFADLRDLRVGDYVVHQDHGIGQFIGLRTVGREHPAGPELPPLLTAEAMADGAMAMELLEITYREEQVLLLPPSRLDLIQRYAAVEGMEPKLDQLGGTSWARTRARVRAGVRELAIDLLALYAQRETSQAPRISPDSDPLTQLEAAFEYEPTQDQQEAIADIKTDLESGRPMDRLLCGDVGFGKTEVAMRAAFKVVDSGFQVAVLAPTTILADQHLETFRARFAEFPVTVEMVSRFRSDAQVRNIASRAAAGEVDILIGTHRLLSRDVSLPRLGLLVIDEEQRFGVAQKERLKELKASVHVLSLTATPVPRTLQLSLAGVRDLSTIATPPRDRQAIETTIVPFSTELVREAIEYEVDRGGQVYYVYNRIEGIEGAADELRRICDGVRIVVGHGQLDEMDLARRMHDFKARKHDVLLATTIIENGIDIANVNTILVHRADRFGLAQLYQLRGRVGRSSELAYCYLLVPTRGSLTPTSRKRLEAIREFTELGAGFRVAARDLEIRGAGDVLGAEQSGHIASVGIETYLKLLEAAVRELRGEEIEDEVSTTIHLPVVATIPESYVADASLRLDLYRRIAAHSSDASGLEIIAELGDRFGAPPDSVSNLLRVAALRRRAESLRVQSISSRGRSLQIRFRRDTNVAAETLIRLVGEVPDASFSPTGVLTLVGVEDGRWLDAVSLVLERLAA